MNWYKLFWLLGVADKLSDFVAGLTIGFGILTGVCIIAWGVSSITFDDDNAERVGKYAKRNVWWFLVPFLLFGTAYSLTPTKSDALLIIAGGAVGQFISSDSSARKLPSDLTNFIHAKLIDAAKETGKAEIMQALNIDTLKDKSKDELIKIIKNK